MKKTFITLQLVCFALFGYSQNCANTSVGFIPISDLKANYWRGYQGGLYPGGSNMRPSAHNNSGVILANNIVPLDINGNVDMVNGKIVWLSIGMSNTYAETNSFIAMTDTFTQLNPKLQLINGAQGGQDINNISDANAMYWTNIISMLTASSLSASQVQVIWFKEAEAQPVDTSFPAYPNSLKNKFKVAFQIARSKFPNAKIAYISDRIYAGYAVTKLNPEPFAYYTGWCVKWLIQDQINGDTALVFNGANPRSPWLSWGPDLWADGINPRSDGLTWICPDDFRPDGTHPSEPTGTNKVANMLFDFFSTDETCTPWFLNQAATTVRALNEHSPLDVYPTLVNNSLNISVPGQPDQLNELIIYSSTGVRMASVKFHSTTGNHFQYDFSGFTQGIYFITLSSGKDIRTVKVLKY